MVQVHSPLPFLFMTTSHILAAQLVKRMAANGLRLTTVESCTGGALANAITNVPGSGDVFKEGFVTYSNEAKIALGIPEKVIADHTVYSLQVAVAMAKAGLDRSTSAPQLCIGITGSLNRADPQNSQDSTVGDVYIAILQNELTVYQEKLNVPTSLSRPDAKLFVVTHTLQKLLNVLTA